MLYIMRCCAIAFGSFLLLGCEDSSSLPADITIRDYSAHFSALPQDAYNPENTPYSYEKEQLGELLFWALYFLETRMLLAPVAITLILAELTVESTQ